MASLQKKVQIRNEHRIHIKRLMAEISGLTQGDVVTYVSYKTRNQPKPPTTSQNQPKPSKTTQNQLNLVISTKTGDGFVQLFICSKNLENICD